MYVHVNYELKCVPMYVRRYTYHLDKLFKWQWQQYINQNLTRKYVTEGWRKIPWNVMITIFDDFRKFEAENWRLKNLALFLTPLLWLNYSTIKQCFDLISAILSRRKYFENSNTDEIYFEYQVGIDAMHVHTHLR
jgi:hypothetical protein